LFRGHAVEDVGDLRHERVAIRVETNAEIAGIECAETGEQSPQSSFARSASAPAIATTGGRRGTSILFRGLEVGRICRRRDAAGSAALPSGSSVRSSISAPVGHLFVIRQFGLSPTRMVGSSEERHDAKGHRDERWLSIVGASEDWLRRICCRELFNNYADL
jgi:hypothetical protein